MSGIPSLETRMDDVRAVMDAVGLERAALLGTSEGGPMSVLFAATYPERTWALILSGGFARVRWAPDYPWGIPDEELRRESDEVERAWGT
jgi:pimeloyl-ACP methyl ester carboxylesterase